MSILEDYTRKTDLRNNNIKPIDGDVNVTDQVRLMGDIDSLNLSGSDEFTASAIPEKNNASHLFVADGQECISLTESIPHKTKRSL